jgi:hypothetical protein
MKNPKESIEGEVISALSLEKQVADAEQKLLELPEFVRFVQLQKQVQEKTAEVWKAVEANMIANDIKSIKGDWGSITITERLEFDVDTETLQKKFTKTVPDTKKIRDTYRLEGKAPKGTVPRSVKFLTRRLKDV